MVKRRSEALHTEEQRQLANDKLRHEFAQKATELDRLIQQQKTEITKNAMEARGTLEEQREQLKGLESKLTKHKQLLDDLEHCNQVG